MPVPAGALDRIHQLIAASEQKEAYLRQLTPYLIDLSLRENPFGSRMGQTLAQKIAILPQLRAFGFDKILLGTLDYAYPDHLEVDDDFMMYLRDHKVDTSGGFAFTDIGRLGPGGFQPSRSMLKMQDYRVPNTLHEIYLSRQGMHGLYDLATLKASLVPSIEWVHANCVGDGGTAKPQIIVNVVDGCDAWSEDPDLVADVFGMLADLDAVVGVSLEDDRGTFMPFQVGAFVASTRAVLPQKKILVHMHAGAGFENASLIESLLSGADGVWGGLPKRAAIVGHGSLGELLANLMRVGNENVQRAYDVKSLVPLATRLQLEDVNAPPAADQAVPEDLPILGTNAYRITLDFFRQIEGRKMDLLPHRIGATQGFRVAPLGSDPIVLTGRLREVMTQRGILAPISFPREILEQMIFLMRQDLREGTRIVYDEPEQLMKLYQRAGG